MDVLTNFLLQVTHWIHPYSSEISLTILATVLVVYGDVLNKKIKRMIRPYHFIIRTGVFIFICAFGYGLLIVYSAPLVKQLLHTIPSLYRGITIIFVFLLLGYLAERRRYI
ncbi:DUF3392 domain-containing protein [Agaribacter marinus]|uniref:DUF3392 domain-containing protein n=1 Tax=Agaribacter marinus TaxID=1431249 RepID=UPI0024E168A1|nr:DUF3392 domain-containing protein [Agaribacter marinus]